MDWFQNEAYNREFDKYVQHLPEEDQGILREHFIPTFREYRERDQVENIALLIQEIINDSTRGLTEKRLRKVSRIIEKAIKFRDTIILPFEPPEPPVSSVAPAPAPVPALEGNNSININEQRTAGEYKTEGNNFFKANKLKEAIACYTRAILIDPLNAIYFSNRSLCYLKLERFEEALLDAEKAVSLDPCTPKSRHKLAMAWSGLGDHGKSCEILEALCNVSNEIQAVLNREQRLLQNTRGVFDFAELERQVNRGEETEIADFIGPVSIEYTGERGCALVASRTIRRGEVICVSKATTFSRPASSQAEALANSNTDTRAGRLIKSLSDKAKRSKLASHRLYHLHCRDRNPIQTQLYSSSGYQLIRRLGYTHTSTADLERLFRYNSFSVSCNPASIETMTTEEPRGIWYIPSFINHSCLPTANQRFIGDISIVTANRDVPADSEITLSYVSVYRSLSAAGRRTELRDRWGFWCECELCQFETDPLNREAIARSLQLRELSIGLSSLSNNPLQIIGPAQHQLLVEVVGLAGELNLGPERFNAAVWHSIVSLTKLRVAPNDSSVYFELIDGIKPYLCQLELTHQLFLWNNCLSYFQYIQLPERSERRLDALTRHEQAKSSLFNTLYK